MNVTDMDTELEVDAATAEAVRRRLADMVASTAVAPDAWDKISARTSAASSAGGRRRGRGRLLVAAAAVLLLAGGVVVDGEGRGGDRVDTDTTPSTIADDEKNFDDRPTDDDDADEAPDSAEDRRPESAPEADQREVDPGSPVPSADDDSESAGSAPSSGPGAGGGDPSPAPGVPGPSPTPDPTTTTTGSTTTTTTTPLPPPRTPGDITIQTSSGFGVELVINDAADFWERGAFVRRTDSEYTGDPAVAGDGYSYVIGFSYTGSYPPACINMARAASPTTAPHTFAFGVMGSDIASVRVLTSAGGSLPALVTTRSFADGARGWMIEEPLEGTTGAEGLNANGEVVARYVLAEARPTCDLATPAP